jgi:hypothetical protein
VRGLTVEQRGQARQ